MDQSKVENSTLHITTPAKGKEPDTTYDDETCVDDDTCVDDETCVYTFKTGPVHKNKEHPYTDPHLRDPLTTSLTSDKGLSRHGRRQGELVGAHRYTVSADPSLEHRLPRTRLGTDRVGYGVGVPFHTRDEAGTPSWGPTGFT